MPVTVMATLRKAVRELEAEKTLIERHLTAVRGLLGSLGGTKSRAVRVGSLGRPRRRRRMTGEARGAISRRMKAYWAKRKAAAAKQKAAPRRK
jgi:hypothetical protein